MKNSVHVLIVDDNEINLQVAEGLITSLFEVECDMALSGAEALSLAGENTYRLIFMDQMMPEMDGIETTRRLRATSDYSEVPIIALTANSIGDVREIIAEAGMNGYLGKPIMVSELSETIKKWLPSVRDAREAEEDLMFNNAVSAAQGISDLDVKAGLANVAGKEDAYENSLKLLYVKIPKIIVVMQECIDSDNLPDFTIHVHGMKSSLAIVGATALSAQALELERSGKGGDFKFCKAALPDFVEGLRALEGKLEPIFDAEPSAEDRQAGCNTAFDGLLSRLASAVGGYEYDEIVSIINEMLDFDFGDKLNSYIRKLKEAADFFDYDGLNQLLGELEADE
jgi:CheY-like chemotaxis protein